jgi:hypothetical protein
VTADPGMVDAAFDVVMRRPCRCPDHHAVTGACWYPCEVVTPAGAMCNACSRCYYNDDLLRGQRAFPPVWRG